MKLHFEAAEKRHEIRHNELMTLAWHIEGLHRRRRMPSLKSMLVKKKGKPRRQHWSEQMHIMSLFPGVVTHYPEGHSNG